jgi:hypothetical protein
MHTPCMNRVDGVEATEAARRAVPTLVDHLGHELAAGRRGHA